MTYTRDTGKARLPALPAVNAQDPSLRNWISAVAERLEVREGSRGNPFERAVTLRDLEAATAGLVQITDAGRPDPNAASTIPLGNGLSASINIDRFVEAIRNTRLFRDLIKRLDDPTRFDHLASEIRTVLLRSIADEASKRGADIQRVDTKIEDANRSLAMTAQEITAALSNNAAGIREVQAAYVSTTQATATKVTQLQVSLGNYYQDGSDGRVSLEQEMLTQASYADGLRAQYTLKVQAGGALAGYGLAASEVNGAPVSAFIISADKFAIVSPSYSGGLTPDPAVNDVPFGVDANGIYLNNNVYVRGQMRVDAGGKTLADGLRGSLTVVVDGFAWADNVARQAVWVALGKPGSATTNNHLVIGDRAIVSTPMPRWRRVEGLWSSTKDYKTGDVVAVSGGKVYEAARPGTGLDPTTTAEAWKVVRNSFRSVAWATDTDTKDGDVVFMPEGPGAEAQNWLCILSHRSSAETFYNDLYAGGSPWLRTRGAYSAVAEYRAGDVVYAGANVYRALRDSTATEVTNTTAWKLFRTGRTGPVAWSPGAAYPPVTFVTGLDESGTVREWMCLYQHTGSAVKFEEDRDRAPFAQDRYWNGSQWVTGGVQVNGNLLVDGSLAASKIDTRGLMIKDEAGNVLFSVGTPLDGTYIAKAAIKEANIDNAAVGTLKIAGNAVTVPAATRFSTSSPINRNGETVVATLNVDFGTESPPKILITCFANLLTVAGPTGAAAVGMLVRHVGSGMQTADASVYSAESTTLACTGILTNVGAGVQQFVVIAFRSDVGQDFLIGSGALTVLGIKR